MNLSQLYYFSKLADMQHYTRAAKELFITQPTLSGSISSLESELGVALFQKKGRNVELTKYGAEFLGYVNASLEQLDKGVAVMKSYSGESDGGLIDLGCIITVQTDYIPQLLNLYHKSSDHRYDFNISQKPSQDLLACLKDGRYDVVFCARDDEAGAEITYVPALAQEFIIAMNADCPLADKDFITPDDLVDVELITYREQIPLGKAVKNVVDQWGFDNVRYAFDDESILAGFAANGVEVALMLDTFFLKHVQGIVVKPFYNNAEERKRYYHTIYMAYNEKKYHPFCVDDFIKFVEAHQLDREDPSMSFFD
ncbi:LysR family transcriptional regulator [Anaerotardibacter muris]|uniref:LysR family transcriptional regulator n=1 Tax=Anaerotardibacter muris TaxID=2941505 RepID=UPI00203CAD17|nr:LysR family transcriptional regulator [Anaerotardibacter muris]